MRHKRASGILLHPTSLPGHFGIGDIGPSAIAFIDFLAETGQHWWQMLPLGPTGDSNSPYQSHSSFAGNPLFISPEKLVADGYLDRSDLVELPHEGPEVRIDFDTVERLKEGLLREAFAKFEPANDPNYGFFTASQAGWLDDFALYMALKHEHEDRPWYEWEPELAIRQPAALDEARSRLDAEIRYHRFVQYLFSQSVAGDARLLPPPRHPPDGRPADLRRRGQRRRLGAARPVPPRCLRPAHGRRGRSARPLRARARPALGQPDLSLGRAQGRALRLVVRPDQGDDRPRRRRAARPLPRFRGLLGSPCIREGRRGRPVGRGSRRRFPGGPSRESRRAAARGRRPRHHHAPRREAPRRLQPARA